MISSSTGGLGPRRWGGCGPAPRQRRRSNARLHPLARVDAGRERAAEHLFQLDQPQLRVQNSTANTSWPGAARLALQELPGRLGSLSTAARPVAGPACAGQSPAPPRSRRAWRPRPLMCPGPRRWRRANRASPEGVEQALRERHDRQPWQPGAQQQASSSASAKGLGPCARSFSRGRGIEGQMASSRMVNSAAVYWLSIFPMNPMQAGVVSDPALPPLRPRMARLVNTFNDKPSHAVDLAPASSRPALEQRLLGLDRGHAPALRSACR